MLEIKEIRRILGPMNLTEVARRIDVHPNVLHRLMAGDVVDPKYSTIKKLLEYFHAEGLLRGE